MAGLAGICNSLQFRRIPHFEEGDYGIGSYRGILFDIQDDQLNLDSSGDMNHWHGQSIHDFRMFQDRVFGRVDFIVSPASVDCITPFADSMAGVREIWVDIKTIGGDTTFYSARKFIDFINTNIPLIYEHISEYSALFFDPGSIGPIPFQIPISWHFNSSYIASNCGCLDGVFDTCYDNIWYSIKPDHINDWISGEYNRGCWDTWLRSPNNGGSADYPEAYVNEHAAFSDGRYAVEITATSHGGDVSSILLPSACVLRPDAPVRGIMVDNYVPHVDSVIVYCFVYPYFRVLYRYGYETEYLLEGEYPDRDSSNTNNHKIWNNLPESAWWTGVAVKYSEPIDEDFLGDVWITVGNQEEVLWHSIENYFNEDYLFHPTAWNGYLGSQPSDSDGQFWQCYESILPLPGHYAGELTLTIGDYEDLYYEGPFDLAGNELDSLPETMAHRRTSAGSFSDEGYEPGNTSFSWGIPRYWSQSVQSSVVIGRKYNGGGSIYQSVVDLDSVMALPSRLVSTTGPSTGDNSRHAWCPYYAGFWVMRSPWFYLTDTVYVVKPTLIEENITWDVVPFAYPHAYPMKTVQPPQTYPYSACGGVVSTHSGNYCYVAWFDHATPEETERSIICMDAASGEFSEILEFPTNANGFYGGSPGDSLRVGITGGDDIYYTPEDFGFGERNSNTRIDAQYGLNVVSIEDDIINRPPFAITNANPVTTSSLGFVMNYLPGIDYSITTYDLSGRRIWSDNGEIINANQEVYASISSWPTGLYFVVARIGDEYYQESICIIH